MLQLAYVENSLLQLGHFPGVIMRPGRLCSGCASLGYYHRHAVCERNDRIDCGSHTFANPYHYPRCFANANLHASRHGSSRFCDSWRRDTHACRRSDGRAGAFSNA